MSQDQIRAALDALRAKLQAEIDQQYVSLEVERAEALAAARREGAQEAEERLAARLQAVEGEWAARPESERAAAAEAAERGLQEEIDRARREAEQRTAEAVAAVRLEMEAETKGTLAAVREEHSRAEQALEAERARMADLVSERDRLREELDAQKERAQESADAERSRVAALTIERDRLREEIDAQETALQAALEAERQRGDQLDRALGEAQASFAVRAGAEPGDVVQPHASAAEITDARAAERESQLVSVERLLDSILKMGESQSLTGVLDTLVDGVADTVPRTALFLANDRMLQGWRARGFLDRDFSVALGLDSAGVLGDAIKAMTLVTVDSTTAPAFAALPAGRAGIAVPVSIGGRAVAVLYADDQGFGEPEAPASWPEAVQILVSHAAACLAHITAARTVQALHTPGRAAAARRTEEAQQLADEDHSARRYARLLVSEIKLYNESAVRVGRERRDLLTRLRPEIDRARRLYEERVSPSVGGRAKYFQQELVLTLADGDPALLGATS